MYESAIWKKKKENGNLYQKLHWQLKRNMIPNAYEISAVSYKY